jgi:hypothetical protein
MVTAATRSRITANLAAAIPGNWVFLVPRGKVRIDSPSSGFDNTDVRNASASQANTTAGLHVCPRCGSRLVQPTCWEQAGDRGHWRLWRRCPECEWHSDEVHGEAAIDAFDEELDLGTRALNDVLKALEQENMQYVADTFTAALAADLITADDFG